MIKTKLKENDIVLCTVKKIEKTTVFLEIENNGEGSMVLSEVAAGRIRNLRQYVAPNKKVVCKILNIENGQIHLSLRRVTAKERDEILEHYKKEKKLINMLKTITENTDAIIKIGEDHNLVDFFEEAKENPSLLNQFFTKEEAGKLVKILSEKTEKEKKVKKIFALTSNSPTGLTDIKEILKIRDVEISYLGSSKLSIIVKAKDFKEANQKMSQTLEEIEKRAKQKHAHFEIKEK